MRHRTPTPAGIAAALLAGAILAACGDGGATGPGAATLSADRAGRIAESVVRQVGVFGFAGAGSSAQSDLVARDVSAETTSTVELESECPGGGTVAFSGEIVAGAEAGTSTLQGDLAYDGCTRSPAEETITLTTRPAFDLTSDLQLVSDTELQMDSGLGGPFDWEVEGDSGSCELDLDSSLALSASPDGTTLTVSATAVGRICGHDVDRSFEATVSTS
jgi:hypothetical protein